MRRSRSRCARRTMMDERYRVTTLVVTIMSLCFLSACDDLNKALADKIDARVAAAKAPFDARLQTLETQVAALATSLQFLQAQSDHRTSTETPSVSFDPSDKGYGK